MDSIAWQKLDKSSGSINGQGLMDLGLYQILSTVQKDSTKSGHSLKVMQSANDYWLLKIDLDNRKKRKRLWWKMQILNCLLQWLRPVNTSAQGMKFPVGNLKRKPSQKYVNIKKKM